MVTALGLATRARQWIRYGGRKPETPLLNEPIPGVLEEEPAQ
jgi:hypothetical protein